MPKRGVTRQTTVVITEHNSYAILPLTRGKYTVVDPIDATFISRRKWYASKKGYAVHDALFIGERVTSFLHKEVAIRAGLEIIDEVDHIDTNKGNNRRSNLRPANRAENARNMPKHSDTQSGYKGVRWHEKTGKYQARIMVDGITHYLGYFDDVEKATKAYSIASVRYHGDFGCVSTTEGTTSNMGRNG